MISSLIMAATTISCSDDAIEHVNNTDRVIIGFNTTAYVVPENSDDAVTISVNFNRPLESDRVLNLVADAKFVENMIAEPSVQDGVISIPVSRGDRGAAFKVKPINNADRDGSRDVTLRIHSLSGPFVLGPANVSTITINDDESTTPLESLANFVEQNATTEEKNTAGIEYEVHLSEAVATDSEITVALTSEKAVYGVDYLSEPVAENDSITLQVTAGLRVISFRLQPLDNNRITGDLKIALAIAHTSGSIRKGNNLRDTLTIKDEELAGKPRGYELTAGTDAVKRFLEYDEQGRISKVHLETYTPFQRKTTESYYYDASGKLVRIEKYPGRDVIYRWENGRITRSDTFDQGLLREYHEYGYDDAGNLGAVNSYYKQPDGTFAHATTTVYLYFNDGNIYKSLTYLPTDDPENPTLISTKTYDSYIEVDNPFPMIEVLPNIKMQTKLATSYRVEESGYDFLYHITYEFRSDGRPAKRTATSSVSTQTGTYHYY